MKGFILFIVGFFIFQDSLLGQCSKKQFEVSGVVTQTSDYCGGAAPSVALLDFLRTPQPLENHEFFLGKGNTNLSRQKVVAKSVTDAQGKFSVKLSCGSYCIVFKEKTLPFRLPENSKETNWDERCLSERYASCEMVIKVNGKPVNDVSVNFHKHCSFRQPCSRYSGPLPP